MFRSVFAIMAVGTALALPTAGHACSMGGFPARRAANTAHFIATPMADTVFAGVGSVQYVLGPSPSTLSGLPGVRTVYGQVVAVERIGGLASRTLGGSVQRVVLVPWDYREDCKTTMWTSGAAWAEVGARGLFTGILRDSAHWANGIPTFDVLVPQLQPYPQQLQRQLRGRSISLDSIV